VRGLFIYELGEIAKVKPEEEERDEQPPRLFSRQTLVEQGRPPGRIVAAGPSPIGEAVGGLGLAAPDDRQRGQSAPETAILAARLL